MFLPLRDCRTLLFIFSSIFPRMGCVSVSSSCLYLCLMSLWIRFHVFSWFHLFIFLCRSIFRLFLRLSNLSVSSFFCRFFACGSFCFRFHGFSPLSRTLLAFLSCGLSLPSCGVSLQSPLADFVVSLLLRIVSPLLQSISSVPFCGLCRQLPPVDCLSPLAECFPFPCFRRSFEYQF